MAVAKTGWEGFFRSQREIIAALVRAPEFYDPRTGSLLRIGRRGYGTQTDPFRAGFLEGIHERAELIRLLQSLDERSRRLLLLWFVEGQPIAEIARQLAISRVHCYRVKDKALRSMLEESQARFEATRAAG